LLLLVRHALTDATGKRLSGTTPGIHLSEEGRRQARALAERMAGLSLQAIYASPLERCVETAEAVAAPHGLPVIRLPAVQEVGYGAWTGRSLAQLTRTKLWRVVQTTPSAVRFPDGEAMGDVQLRAVSALRSLAERHPGGRVAVVTHADVIRMAIADLAGVHLDLFQRLVVSPASVSAVAMDGGPPRILRVNDTGDLGELAPRPRRRTAPSRDRRRASP
jgi:probable phosphomutase (TIGR03848 family)